MTANSIKSSKAFSVFKDAAICLVVLTAATLAAPEAFTSDSRMMESFFSIVMNFSKISAVAYASSTAR